ncbi:MAG: NAD(P)H-binding protein [Gammaproteobacteria bacterium]
MNDVQNSKKTILVVGATGYIGSAVVAEAVRSGHQVVAVTRSRKNDSQFEGAEVVMADVSDPASIARAFNRKIDVVISCLATRSGVARDFDDIDYKATLNVLNAAKQNGTSQFILLSAICVRKPDLPLQLAKLKMEDELIRSGMHYTIVRPTAYFWVFDSQSRNIKKGKPGFLLGSGEQARHNPIAKEDLAEFMVGCAGSSEHINRIHIIGGPEVPGNIISSKDALLMIFEAMGKEPKLISVPTWLFQAAIGISGFIGHFWRKSGVFHEFLRIIYYYSHDDMRAPGYGSRTIRQYIMQASSSAAD